MKSKIWGRDAEKLHESRTKLAKEGINSSSLEEFVDHTKLTDVDIAEIKQFGEEAFASK